MVFKRGLRVDPRFFLWVPDGIHFYKTVKMPHVIHGFVVGFGVSLLGGTVNGFGWVDDEESTVDLELKTQVGDKWGKDNAACAGINNGHLLAFFPTIPFDYGVVSCKIGAFCGPFDEAILKVNGAGMAEHINGAWRLIINRFNRKVVECGDPVHGFGGIGDLIVGETSDEEKKASCQENCYAVFCA